MHSCHSQCPHVLLNWDGTLTKKMGQNTETSISDFFSIFLLWLLPCGHTYVKISNHSLLLSITFIFSLPFPICFCRDPPHSSVLLSLEIGPQVSFSKTSFDLYSDLSRRLSFLASHDWFSYISRLIQSHYLAIQAGPFLLSSSHSYFSSPTAVCLPNLTSSGPLICICKLLPINSLYTSTFSLSRPSSTFWPGSYF